MWGSLVSVRLGGCLCFGLVKDNGEVCFEKIGLVSRLRLLSWVSMVVWLI